MITREQREALADRLGRTRIKSTHGDLIASAEIERHWLASLAHTALEEQRDRIIDCVSWIVAQDEMDVATVDEGVDLWIAAGMPEVVS